MTPPRILLGVFLCLAACSAPQGKKIGSTASTGHTSNTHSSSGLPAVASGPDGGGSAAAPAMPSGMPTTTTSSVITYADRDGVVGVRTAKTLTVKLPALKMNGYEWRLGEIPDPTVLKLVSSDYTPGESPTKAGEQTLVFEAVGPGDVNVKLWYGTLWNSREGSTRSFNFTASVSSDAEKPAPKPKKSEPPKKENKPAPSKPVPSQPIAPIA